MKTNNAHISLNGVWSVIKDTEQKFMIDEIRNKYLNGSSEYKISVPSNWQLSGLNNYSGTLWYIKEFEFSNKDITENIKQLYFYGVDYFAEVWLNWNYIGKHEGYFQTFSFNVSEQIKSESSNIIVVKVASPKEEPGNVWPNNKKLIKGIFNHHDCRPGGWSLEHGQDLNTGGIWNDVLIKYGYKVIVDSAKLTSKILWEINEAEINIELRLLSISSIPGCHINFQIKTPDNNILNFKKEINIESTISIKKFSFSISEFLLWNSADLGKPDIYKLNISSPYFDDYKVSFGIREVVLDSKKQFYINKKKVFLRGTNIIPTQFLSELTSEKISRLILLLHEANINIVRVHAHVNRKELYEAFDMAGILVWQDFALQWTYEDSEEFRTNAVTQIKEMINGFYNHPSIVFWCCHNEPGDQIKTLDTLLYEAVNTEDQSRIIRIASNYEEHPYDGWYWGNKEHFAATPMGPLVTEFGAQAIPARSSLNKFLNEDEIEKPDWAKWEYHNFQYEQTFNVAEIEKGNSTSELIENSQKYQAELIKTAIDYYRRERFNGINGIFQFMFIDCWSSITWSVVDYYGEKKKGFYSLKQAFQPLYISVRMRQIKYFPNSKLQCDIWLINDLLKNYENCSLVIFLEDVEIGCLNNLKIYENDLEFISYQKIDSLIPGDIISSKKLLQFKLYDSIQDQILSENTYEIEIVNRY